MAYVDVNTPVIEQITLPSGNSYYIADREIRDVVDTLEQQIAGGVAFIIAWNGTSTPQPAQIPAGVTVIYNGTAYTGTLSAETSGSGTHAQAGAFYLVKSGTPPEVRVESSNVGTVTVNQATFASATNYSTNRTYSFQYPAGEGWHCYPDNEPDFPVSDLSTYGITYTGTPSSTSSITVYTPSSYLDVYDEYVPVGAEGSKTWEKIGDTLVDLTSVVTDVTLNKQTANVIGASSTMSATNPTITLATGATGDIDVVTGDTEMYFHATASGGGAAWNSKDQKAAITALGTPSTESAVKSVTPTTKKLATTTVTGVSGSTTPSVIQSRTSQTTADGSGTASSTNTDWLKGISVSNGVLTIGAATLDTQTTYSADAPGTITVPTAASSATTVATGATTTTGSGADIVTDVSVGDTFNAVTGYASPTTANVIGASSTFTNTQPTVTLASSPDQTTWTDVAAVKYVSGITKTKASASASGTAVSWNSKDQKTVLTNSTDVAVTKGK